MSWCKGNPNAKCSFYILFIYRKKHQITNIISRNIIYREQAWKLLTFLKHQPYETD